MSKTLLIVESGAKAKTIQKYLGPEFIVKASVGHIVDLPKSGGLDRTTWEEHYELVRADVVPGLRRAAAADVTRILLASDPDREGEAIAWHLARELKSVSKGKRVQRVVYHEITAAAIRAAIASATEIAMPIVDAQRTRRVLDRVVGYDISSLVRRVNARSAGRVQTPTLHALCERERAILAFTVESYYVVSALYQNTLLAYVSDPGDVLPSRHVAPADSKEGATTEEEEAQGAEEREAAKSGLARPPIFRITREEDATRLTEALRDVPHVVKTLLGKPVSRFPFPPYESSSLQQDASRKLNFKAARTMALAQMLYEAGLITYMRTDSVSLSAAFLEVARARIAMKHREALPAKPPRYRDSGDAQAAHEAIRPTRFDDISAATFVEACGPADAKDAMALWKMIGARTLASQCKPAIFDRTVITIGAGTATLGAVGQVLRERGFLVYWAPYAQDKDSVLPLVTVGESLPVERIGTEHRATSPPTRYDEGSLTNWLKKAGVGRPSTYANTIELLKSRGYVGELARGKKTFLQPTEQGLLLDDALVASYPTLVSPEYTATMETSLDAIERGSLSRVGYLRDLFYPEFERDLASARQKIDAFARTKGVVAAASGAGTPRPSIGKTCPKCGTADLVDIRFTPAGGKGNKEKKFIACAARCGFTQENKSQKWKVAGCVRPGCGGTMVERKSQQKKGETYWKCARCDTTARADGSVGGRYAKSVGSRGCPRCTAHPLMTRLVLKESLTTPTPSGFDVCDACKLTLDLSARVSEAPCPACGGALVERQPKELSKPTFWSCVHYPTCRFAADLTALAAALVAPEPGR